MNASATIARNGRTPIYRGFNSHLEGRKVSPLDFQKEIGLDWTVAKEEISFNMIETAGMDPFRAVVRSDNRTALGVVGKDYESVQNDEMFRFLADLSEFDMDVEMVAGGALGKGEIVWSLAKVPSLSLALGTDIVDSFIFMSNGHAGNRNLAVDFYTLRKICSNGMHALTRATSGKLGIGNGWKLKHTSGISDRFAQVQGVVRDVVKDYTTTKEAFQILADTPASWATVEAIAAKVYGAVPAKVEGKSNKAHTIATNRMEDLSRIWNSATSKGIETEGTLWTAVNAVTEWAEHESITRSGNYTQEESRIIGNFLGGSASTFKEDAYTYALSLAGIA